jgi:hypothetical protein
VVNTDEQRQRSLRHRERVASIEGYVSFGLTVLYFLLGYSPLPGDRYVRWSIFMGLAAGILLLGLSAVRHGRCLGKVLGGVSLLVILLFHIGTLLLMH